MRLKKCIVGALLTALPSMSPAEGPSLAVGADFIHDRGAPYTEARYGWQRASTWVRAYGLDYFGLGADYVLFEPGRLSLSLGVSLAEADHLVGSSLRYTLRVGFSLNHRWGLDFLHESNCHYICRDGSPLEVVPHGPAPNRGRNALAVRYYF